MKDSTFGKFVVLVNAMTPIAILAWDAARHHLGVNTPEFIIRTTGMLSLIFLLLSLLVTPLRKFTGVNFFSHFRKELGLTGFFYVSLHLLSYLQFDRSWILSSVFSDVVSRWFILVGMLAFLLLVPLAATSTSGAIKRLGARRWKQLHRLAYIAAALGVFHYYLSVKADTRQPVAFAIVLGFLLAVRLIGAMPSSRPGAPVGASS